MTHSSFATLLRRLRKRYPSVRAFARALDVDPSHLSRAMGPHSQPFDVRGCLRLARVTAENPSVILRAAGKQEIADLVEALYGPATKTLTPRQQALLDAVDDCTPSIQESLLKLAQGAQRRGVPNHGT